MNDVVFTVVIVVIAAVVVVVVVVFKFQCNKVPLLVPTKIGSQKFPWKTSNDKKDNNNKTDIGNKIK